MPSTRALGRCANCKILSPIEYRRSSYPGPPSGWHWILIHTDAQQCPICDHAGKPEIIFFDDREMIRQYRKQFEAVKEVTRLKEWLGRIKWNLGDGDDHPNCAAALSCVLVALAGIKSEDCTQLTTCKCDYCLENPPT